jgi:hypothetical protein
MDWDPDGSERVCLFGLDQSGVGAALCRAHSKTPSFFRRHALESMPIADTNSLVRPNLPHSTGRQIQKRQRTAALHDAVANLAKTGANPAGWCTSSWRASRCEALSVAARPTPPNPPNPPNPPGHLHSGGITQLPDPGLRHQSAAPTPLFGYLNNTLLPLRSGEK